MKITPTILVLSILFLAACGQRTSENLDLNPDDVEISNIQISEETMIDIIQSAASPLEVTTLIKSLNVPFSASNLPDPKMLSSEISALEMAFRLGMLYTDLGYMNLYEQADLSEDLLSAIDRLAEGLRINQYFDSDAIHRAASNSSSIDSLIYISIHSFNQMGNSLRQSERGDQSALIIAGAWLEGLYMATQVAATNNNEHLRDMIGDQKVVLNDLLLVLNYYNSEALMKNYITDLEKILNLYDQVEIINVVGDPETVEKDGMLEVVQNETSQLIMSDEVLDQITKATAQVRNAHYKTKPQVQ